MPSPVPNDDILTDVTTMPVLLIIDARTFLTIGMIDVLPF